MTLDAAREFVANASTPHTIYRLPAWGTNTWAVTLKTRKELPDNAIFAAPSGPAPAPQPPPPSQGRLF